MARFLSVLPPRLAGRVGQLPRSAHQAWSGPARAAGAFKPPRCLGSRDIVSLTAVLDKADNVLPCYAIIQRQLGAEVADEPQQSEEVRKFAHSITWSWNGKEIAMHGEGRSKKSAKNEAARHVLKQLMTEEGDLMDPTQNPMLAQWAIQWLNQRLAATMEVSEEKPEVEESLEEGGEEALDHRERTHTCLWSCPQVPGETAVRGTAGTAAESRRQIMAELYKELPASLDDIIRGLPMKEAGVPQDQGKAPTGEANLSKVNVMHNEVTQQLAIRTKYVYSKSVDGDMECSLTWSFYDEAKMAQMSEEVVGVGRSKEVAKGRANQAMLVKQGHLPDFDADFHRDVSELKQTIDHGPVHEALPKAQALMERTEPSTWAFFLPDVMRSVLSENDYGGLSEMLNTARTVLGDRGLPIDLWESLLDEASFSMRHFHLAQSALQQLATFPLADEGFPGLQEKQYFNKFRHLLALERHGGLLHGVQQYELDPHMFCSVPLVDVHNMQADKVVLTSIPEAGSKDILEGGRSLRSSDIVLLVPLEALDDMRASSGFDDFERSANWQHPGAWLASVTTVKGDSRMGEEVRVHTRRISRFASDAQGAAEGDAELTAPIANGRQYRLFHIAMETPTARMLAALRCLCQVKLPAWSENFEGRRPSFTYSEGVRRIVMGTPEEASTGATKAARSAAGGINPDQVMQRMCGEHGRFASLTPTQRQAVERSLGEQMSLIQGPPGTGKTHVACVVIAAWVQRYAPLGERVLAVADSNVAADNMYTRLEAFGIEAVRVGQGKEVGSMVGDQLWAAVKNAKVVIATCIGSGMEMLTRGGDAKYFHRVIIDECTQACEPAALVALGRSAEQVVLVGDQNQLPATVLSRAAKDEGLGVSLFERMVLTNGLEPTLLIEQRRMHSSISEFPNITFYQGKLVNAIPDSSLAPVPGFPWPNPDCRVCFVDVSGSEQKRGFSAYNTGEASAVAEVVQKMLEGGVSPQELCILTAYLAQRDEIRRAIGDRNLWHAQANLSIDTVDGYQGMERDIVMFSAARSNAEGKLGFLSDARRMNVMLTRARRGLIVFGNGDVLRGSNDTGSHWGAWLNWAESKGAVIKAADLAQLVVPARPLLVQADPWATPASTDPFSSPSAQPVGSAMGGAFANGGTMQDSHITNPFPNAAPPPPPPPQKSEWEKVYSEEHSRHYYWNTATNQTTWDTPPGL